jgi:hypothetical protein
MQYYTKEENWKQILELIKSVKGINSKDEKPKTKKQDRTCDNSW